MALEQLFGEPIISFGSDEDISLKKRNSVSVPKENSGNMMGCFDCNICLDSAHDPVVTFCGHLYCWPCIFKWLQVENSSPAPEVTPKCPVCKSHISNSSLVPLYGRGTSSAECGSNEYQVDMAVPRRPQAIWTTTTQVNTSPSTSHVHQQLHRTSLYFPPSSIHHQRYIPHAFSGYAAIAPSNIGGIAMTRLFSPMVVMFGEMLLARMLGGSEASSFSYPYPSSYPIPGGGGSSRMRRQEMQVDKSLNRLSIFLFCAFILCLLLF